VSEIYVLGRQVGDFLRGLLLTTEPDTPQPANKYVVGDASIVNGPTVSLDLEGDGNRLSSPLEQDVVFNGVIQFPSGRSSFIQQVIARDYANALSLVRKSEDPSKYHLIAGGALQPSDQPGQPHEISIFSERTVPGTSVQRVTGQLWDPKSQTRISFTVTHDPEPITIAVVTLTAALICGAVVITEALLDNCVRRAAEQCGERGVRKIVVKRTYGFSWKGGPEVGCGQDCQIECNS
jgi:hypothetical protein